MDKKQYTIEYLKKYFNKELSDAEMHQLEKEALDDPFLYEALEGLEKHETETVEKDINLLKRHISDSSLAPPWYKNRRYLTMAAAIILIFVLVIPKIAERRNSELPQLAYNESSFSPDSAMTKESQNNSKINSPQVEREADVRISSKQQNVDLLVANNDNQRKETKRQAQTAKNEQLVNEIIDTASLNEHLLTPPKLDESLAIMDMDETIIVEEDLMEIEVSDIDETVALAMQEVAPAYVNKKEGLSKAQATSSYSMQNRATSARQDGLIVAQKKMNADERNQMDALNHKSIPSIGWIAYENYLSENVQSLDLPEIGEVELVLTISDKGKIKKVEIFKGLCTRCDKGAIRMVKKGPDWVTESQNGRPVTTTQRVIVRFR